MVICYGSNGHIAIEPLLHNHCHCAEADEDESVRQVDRAYSFTGDHSHCEDTLATSQSIVAVRKDIDSQFAEIFVQGLRQKSTFNLTTFFFRLPFSWDTESTSFFTPLQSIILLA